MLKLSNLHGSQNSTEAILDDTIFTVKALSDKTTSDPNSSPALVSKGEMDKQRVQYEAKIQMMEEQFQARLQKQQTQFYQHYQERGAQLQEYLQAQLQKQLKAKEFQIQADYQAQMSQISDLKSQILELAKVKTNQQIPQPIVNSTYANQPPQVATMPYGGHILNSPARHTTQVHCPPQGHIANMSNTLPGNNTTEIQATINRIENSISSNNSNLDKTLLLSSLLASRELYISGASTCDGKDPSTFKIWLDDVASLSTLSGKACNEAASATSKGPLYRYTQELVNAGHA